MIKYKYLWAWDTMMHSGRYWKDMKQREAVRDNAPEDAVYKDVGGNWHRFRDVESEETKKRVQSIVDLMK